MNLSFLSQFKTDNNNRYSNQEDTQQIKPNTQGTQELKLKHISINHSIMAKNTAFHNSA